MSAFALVGARIFDGARMLDDHSVVIDGGRVRQVVPVAALSSGIERREVEGLLTPGFIDVQVNGGGGVLFNDTPTVDAIRAIGAAHRKFGTTGFLPTLITDTREKMTAAVAAVRDGLAAGVPGLLGVHLEGPFIGPKRKGAHRAEFIRPMQDEDFRIMTSLGAGRTLVTLAPEREEMAASRYVARLSKAGVIVSAGHTEASYETLAQAREEGLTAYTHLFNAMPPLMGREPGPVGAALDDREGWCSIIADMQHVSPPALRIALAARGTERTMLITDAMSPTGTSVASFELTGQKVFRRNDRLEFADGTLAGADLDMAAAVRNVHRKLGVGLASALAMASRVPADFLRCGNELGRIAPGYRASFVLLDEAELTARSTWIDGIADA